MFSAKYWERCSRNLSAISMSVKRELSKHHIYDLVRVIGGGVCFFSVVRDAQVIEPSCGVSVPNSVLPEVSCSDLSSGQSLVAGRRALWGL